MNDKELPKPIDGGYSPLSPKQKDLCERFDKFARITGDQRAIQYSDLLRGAFYTAHPYNRLNPDWMAQAAHSIRDILYGFWEGDAQKKKYLRSHGTTGDIDILTVRLSHFHGFFTSVAHHNFKEACSNPIHGVSKPRAITARMFENILSRFEDLAFAALRRQIDAHREINALLRKNPSSAQACEAQELIDLNPDARQYFYHKADRRWLTWLWDNGFLNAIKERAEDPTRCGYKTPELNYLLRMSEKNPKKVTEIMLAVPISASNFNPEVIDRFLYICSKLPAKQLTRMVEKIHKENWVRLMKNFHNLGFEYEKMFKRLSDARIHCGILALAETLLTTRAKTEVKMGRSGFSKDTPFYLPNLIYTKIFEYLSQINGTHNKEFALAIITRAFRAIVYASCEEKKDGALKFADSLPLYGVNFFTLTLGERESLSHRDDIRDLVATIKILASDIVGKHRGKARNLLRLYKKCFASLPECESVWRLRLFVLSMNPDVFKQELKNAFFRVFATDRYYEIVAHVEYETALQRGFFALSEKDKREYVKKILEYFGNNEKEEEEQKWRRECGWRILSSICAHLSPEESEACERIFKKKCDKTYTPMPSYVPGEFGVVVPQSPIPEEIIGRMSLPGFVKKLRDELSPSILSQKYGEKEDFLRPINAEGVADKMKKNMLIRPIEYIKAAELFFDEEGGIDRHYTYSFLRGLQDILQNHRDGCSGADFDPVIKLLIAITNAGTAERFERKERERSVFSSWLAGWDSVHMAMADVLQELLDEHRTEIIDFKKQRGPLLKILKYLLSYPDPEPEDEKIESARMKTKPAGSDNYVVSDPHSTAINTARGRAFQSFALFVCRDGKQFNKKAEKKIAEDVKEIYKETVAMEKTRALMFMFGRFLPTFYFHDREYARSLLSRIFSEEPAMRHLCIAAWEGYLSENLYEEIFFDAKIQKLYMRGLTIAGDEDPGRKHAKDPDEGLAVHLALAHMFYPGFGVTHPLFKAFWKRNDTEQIAEFAGFLGRLFVSGSNTDADELLRKELSAKKRLRHFWDMLLNEHKNPEVFKYMGFWISLEKDIFEAPWLAEHVRKTLEKTKGALDFEFRLTKNIVALANAAPEDALAIARLYLFDGCVHGDNRRAPMLVDNAWFDALKALYVMPTTRHGVETLINELIRDGGEAFWKFEEILKE